MAKTKQDTQAKEYAAYEIVPKEKRHMNYPEYTLTWAGGALQPTVWTLGGTLICAGFLSGSMAIILASIVSGLVIGSIGLIGYKTGISSSGLFRIVLGIRGSKLTSFTSLINSIGWVAIGCYVAAISMSYIFGELFGMPAYGEPGSEATIILGSLIICALAYLGVVIGGSKTLKLFETIMMIALIIFSVIVMAALISRLSWGQVIGFTVPEEYAMTFPVAFNMMFVVGVTYATMVCDYTRYTKRAVTALTGQMVGSTFSSYLFCAMGMLGPIVAFGATGIFDLDNANPASLCMSLGLGMPLLLIIVFSVVTTDMLDFYSGGLSIQNLFPKVSYRASVSIVGVICFFAALVPVFASSLQDVLYAFLDVLGAIFPPVYSIILVDFYLIHHQKYNTDDIDKEKGTYWYSNGFNLCSIACWAAGIVVFILFNALNIAGSSIGYAISASLVTGLLYFAAAKAAVRRGYYHVSSTEGP